jgi:hypothetical protein
LRPCGHKAAHHERIVPCPRLTVNIAHRLPKLIGSRPGAVHHRAASSRGGARARRAIRVR